MAKYFAYFLFVLIPISCKKNNNTPASEPDKASELTTINLTVDTWQRSFVVYKPTGYNNAGKMPLIFANHGGQGSPQDMLQLADFRSIADRDKVVLIYPAGYQKTWNDGRPTTANQLGIDDINFFRAMCDYAVTNLSVDAAKIYATGMSNGGFMASRLGCELSDKIAAIAVVSASVEQGVFNNCNPAKPVPTIVMQGTLDPFVPFNGGVVSPGVGGTVVSHIQAVAKFVANNKCNATPTTVSLPDLANDGTTTTERRYIGGTNSAEVLSYVILNGGHTWPQGYQYLPETTIGKTSQDINANEVIWAFFRKFKL